MPKKLKVFQTSLGFFDLAVAAPSMKAAAAAWGSDPDIFRQGFAKQTDEPAVVEGAMAKPGLVLRRPVGSNELFTEHSSLPKVTGRRKAPANASVGQKAEAAGPAEATEAKSEAEDQARKKADAERERAKKKRERSVAKADAALERARRRHEQALRSIEKRQKEVAKDEVDENDRWENEQQAHTDALKDIGV